MNRNRSALRPVAVWDWREREMSWCLRVGGVGTKRAEVWANGAWVTCDATGTLGRMGEATTAEDARREAMLAAEAQGFLSE